MIGKVEACGKPECTGTSGFTHDDKGEWKKLTTIIVELEKTGCEQCIREERDAERMKMPLR